MEFLTQVLHEACQSALSVDLAAWWSAKCSSSSASLPGGHPSTVVAVIEPGFMLGVKSSGTSVISGLGGFERFPEEGVAF